MRIHPSVAPAVLLALPVAALAAGTHAPAVATGSAVGIKASAGAPRAPLPAFSKVDKNGDGAIEWSEAKAVGVPKKLFDEEDVHHDGKLTMTEWQIVKVAMVPTHPLPATAAATAPAVPEAVVKAMEAPNKATVTPPAGGSDGGHAARH